MEQGSAGQSGRARLYRHPHTVETASRQKDIRLVAGLEMRRTLVARMTAIERKVMVQALHEEELRWQRAAEARKSIASPDSEYVAEALSKSAVLRGLWRLIRDARREGVK